ncbi:unnamed protein product [Trichobilharzia szidati]|nr:unnamed protein product [Trichobilharzia szidati]
MSKQSATPMYQSSDPQLVWHRECDVAKEDFVATWSSGYQRDSLSRLNSLLIWPDEVEAVGPRIKELRNQTKFCSAHLVEEVVKYKDQLDEILVDVNLSSLRRSNPHQSMASGIFNNRDGIPVANIDSIFNGMFRDAANQDEILYFAEICSVSCGFSEYILWRRCYPFYPLDSSRNNESNDDDDDRSCRSWNSSKQPVLSAKGFWFTSSIAGRKMNSDVAPMVACRPCSGDIAKWFDLKSFASLISRGSNGVGVHVVFAGWRLSLDEVQSKRTFVCQCLCALTILRPGGHFLMELSDTLTEFTAGLIYIMGHLFEEIFIVKPIACSQSHSIRFRLLVCRSLRTELTSMAGCKPPSPPPRVNCDRECVSKHQKTVAGGSQKSHKFEACKNEAITKQRIMKTTTATHLNDAGANDDYKNGSTPLSLVIKYLKQVSEKLKYIMASRDCKIDILRMCRSEIMEGDDKFMRFMRNMNEKIIIRQCIAMSKVIAFAQDSRLDELSRCGLAYSCLMKWKIPHQSEFDWPEICPEELLRLYLVMTDEFLTCSEPLPAQYHPSMRLTSLRKTHDIMNRLMSFTGRRIGLVCGSPSLTSTGAPAQPMLIFSNGRKHRPQLEKCTVDGYQWANLSEMIPGLQPRLPAATVVWGQAINEICLKTGSEKPALFVYDVLCIYGRDCRRLGYRNRMKLAERMANVVNFPDMEASNIRTAPLVNLSRLEDYMNGLRLFPIRNSGQHVPMHCFPDGFAFQPHSLLLVEHLKKNWLETVNQNTGKLQYFNRLTLECTSHLPDSEQLTFAETQYTQLPVKAEDESCTDVMAFVGQIEKMKVLLD